MYYKQFKFTRAISTALLLCGITYAQIPAGHEKGLASITGKEIKENVTFLASDSLKGRPAGSKENLIAAMYIAEKFQQYGLTPLFPKKKYAPKKKAELTTDDDNSENVTFNVEDESKYDPYLQKFNLKKFKLSENNSLSIINNNKVGNTEKKYKYKQDFLIQYKTSDDISLNAPIVFAGYGIDKGENGYNDFVDAKNKPIDIKDKIVVIVDGFPRERDTASAFSKSRNSLYRSARRKADIAHENGAAAVFVISSPFKTDVPLNYLYGSAFEKESYVLPETEKKGTPIIYLRSNVVKDLFRGTGKSLTELLEATDKTLKPCAFEIPDKKVSLAINFDSEILNTQNVVAFLEGTDPKLKDEILVVGAHYDHIGLGYYGAGDSKNKGKIHNGADDNASGVSGLIEIAEAFSKNPPKRSVLFIAFTAEENGLHGSRFYVNEQPLKPLNKTIAMINMDMIGRNETSMLSVGGAFYSQDFIKMVEEANKPVGFELFYNMGLLSMASDQAHFLRKNIPALFFFSGMHDDYHMPTDKVEKLNIEKVEKASKLGYLTGWIVTNSSTKPTYHNASMEERAQIVRESMERQKKHKQQAN